jgi:hypothetical protein
MISTAQIARLKVAAIAAAASMLAACTCSTSDIGSAARYSNDGLSVGSREQENRWLANPRLDSFLHRSIRSDGLCTGSTGTEVVFPGEPFGYCGSGGTIAIRAEVGPGDAVTSMTYWTPVERTKKSGE